MTGAGTGLRLDRRTLLRALSVLGAGSALPACSSPRAGLRLAIAAGSEQGVYYTLGTALARAWQERLGLDTAPVVRATAGSVDNLQMLAAGRADIAFSQVDTAADGLDRIPADDPRARRALARIYDDVVHVVVPATSTVTTPAQLRGARVSVGARNSGVFFTAQRLLRAVGLSPDHDLRAAYLGINDSADALRRGEIDAFFWSGGLPTPAVSTLARTLPIRLLDLHDILPQVRAAYPVYSPGTVPAATYGIPGPVTTLLVRNFLIVAAAMADDVAYALVDAMFAHQPELARASPAALTIDLRAAIGTQPVPLHPGAERYYRDAKNA